MKKLITFAIIAVLAACSEQTGNESTALLSAKRDSLQKEQLNIKTQLNNIDAQIAELDSSINPDDLSLVKQIAAQKNRIVAIEAKIKSLENQKTAREEKHLIPVAAKTIIPEPFNHYIITYGKVEAKNYGMISPEMGGRIDKIHVKRGQEVAKGALLVSLNADALKTQIAGVKSSLDFATQTFEKQDALWKENIGSEIEYLSSKNTKESLEAQLKSLEAQVRMTQLRAPFTGIVDKIFSKEGEIAGPGFPVIEFVDLKKLTITADVSEAFLGKIKKGQIVELSFSSLPDLQIKAPIVRVSKVITSLSRTFEIEMEINNVDDKILPNLVSTIKINDFSTKDAFIVPSLAIRKDFTGNYVYTVEQKNNENIVAKKYVTTGLTHNENSMITSGLVLNDQVIVKGYHLVSAGVSVNLVK